MGLDTVELAMDVERKFQIDLPNDELSHAYTVGDLVDLVLKHLPPGAFPPETSAQDRRNEVFQQVRDITLKYAPGDPSKIKRESRFVQDLHLE
jgi:acyl carrier protein